MTNLQYVATGASVMLSLLAMLFFLRMIYRNMRELFHHFALRRLPSCMAITDVRAYAPHAQHAPMAVVKQFRALGYHICTRIYPEQDLREKAEQRIATCQLYHTPNAPDGLPLCREDDGVRAQARYLPAANAVIYTGDPLPSVWLLDHEAQHVATGIMGHPDELFRWGGHL